MAAALGPCPPAPLFLPRGMLSPGLNFARDEDSPGINSPSRRSFNSQPNLDMEGP